VDTRMTKPSKTSNPKASPAPVARLKKLAVAGGGNDEWEEF